MGGCLCRESSEPARLAFSSLSVPPVPAAGPGGTVPAWLQAASDLQQPACGPCASPHGPARHPCTQQLAQPLQTFGGADLYPSAIDKACRYAFGIISNHPFLDGNKRTGAALLGAYLRMSGVDFRPVHAAFLKVMLGVADGSVSYDALVEWTKSVVV